MNEESGSMSVKTVVAGIVPVLYLAAVLMMLVTQSPAPQAAEFTVVDLTPGDITVNENETVDISATIRNTGESTETQDVRITLGEAHTEQSVTLESGESETIWLRDVPAESLGIGETAYRVRTHNDTLSATLTVDSQRRSKFAISELQPTAASLEDEDSRITVSARIENVGGQTGETMVEFKIANKTYYRELVALDPGESEMFTVANLDLWWLPPGTHSYTIVTENDSVQGSVKVPQPATLELRDLDLDRGPLDIDRPVTVSFTVENTGEVFTEETVQLVVGGELIRSERVTLAGGESTRVTFEDIDPSRLGIGVHQYQLTAGDATTSGTWVIEGHEPTFFEITSLEPQSITVDTGDSIDIAATIENTGQQTGNETIELRFNGVTRYKETVELAPGEHLDFEVHNLSLAGIPPGEYELSVVTAADEETGLVLVVEGTEEGDDGQGGGADDSGETDQEDDEDEEEGRNVSLRDALSHP